MITSWYRRFSRWLDRTIFGGPYNWFDSRPDPWSRSAEQRAKDEQAMRDAMDGWHRFNDPQNSDRIDKALDALERTVWKVESPAIIATPKAYAFLVEHEPEIYKIASGRWKWRLRIDGIVMRTSPKSYTRKWSALRGWERAKRANA